MQRATRLGGRLCRQCAEARPLRSISRGMSLYSRRRQKRNMSGQASTWPSQPPFMEPFPFPLYPMPAPILTPFDWKGKARALDKLSVAYDEGMKPLDRPYKLEGNIKVQVGEEVERVEKSQHHSQRIDLRPELSTLPYESKLDVSDLFVWGTSSISLSLLQNHCKELESASTTTQLRFVIWLTRLTRAPTNDVTQRGRRWHVNIYRRSELEQKQGIRPTQGTMPTSIDMLCADLMRKEIRRNFSQNDLQLLKSLAFQALQRNAFRTVQAIEDTLKETETLDCIEQLPICETFLLSMMECFFIKQAKRGEWEEIWRQRDDIIGLLRRQRELKRLYIDKDANNDWRLDTLLIKSLNAHCAQHNAQHHRIINSKTQVNLASDRYYMEQMTILQKQITRIYGKISDNFLTNFILGLARGVEPGSNLTSLPLINYFDRLKLTNLAQRLFNEKCQQDQVPSAELMRNMLELELHWERNCRMYQQSVGKARMLQQAQKHRRNVKAILQLLSEYQEEMEAKVHTMPPMVRRQVMEDLRAKAMSTQVSIKLLLLQGDCLTALQRLEDYLESVRPDEDYFHLTGSSLMPTKQTQQATTAKAMMKTRRHTRGSFISIALYLNKSESQDKRKGIPILLQLILDSIKRGVWDPWPLKRDFTRKSLRLSLAKPHFVDPTAQLSTLCTRLLAMCKPIVPVHRDIVAKGFTIVDPFLSSTFHKVLDGIALVHKTMEQRLKLLNEESLLNLEQNRTRSKNTLRDIYVARGTSAAQCIWAAICNPSEQHLVGSRLRLLFEEIFIPLGVPGKGWSSARMALQMLDWTLYKDGTSLECQVWSLFNEANQSRLEVAKLKKDNLMEGGTESKVQTRMVQHSLHRRIVRKEGNRIAREKMRSSAIHSRPRR